MYFKVTLYLTCTTIRRIVVSVRYTVTLKYMSELGRMHAWSARRATYYFSTSLVAVLLLSTDSTRLLLIRVANHTFGKYDLSKIILLESMI